MLTAIIHIGGAVIALFVLTLAGLWVAAWEGERNAKKRRRDAAISLGISVEELESEAMAPRLVEFCSAKFSSELFRNRLSDLCGVVRLVWGWVGSIAQVIVLVVVVWNTFTDTVDNAVYAWSAVGIALFFWVSSVGFSLICYFITGRYPGEAKQARKALSAVLEERKVQRI
ncbi:conserved membrane hypothetical protein [Cupriavidus necator]|uniref:Transmembrane protein n=1 Tax=Cupriavidus necator TaxID=106590 RepID=A0A1K0IRH7_CUPNE|nr:conserved membrane hypothetical protein [Cupriavidus necator]